MKLLASANNVVLRQDTSSCLIAGIGFHDRLEGSIEVGEDCSVEESCWEFIIGLLLCVSSSEGTVFCQVH